MPRITPFFSKPPAQTVKSTIPYTIINEKIDGWVVPNRKEEVAEQLKCLVNPEGSNVNITDEHVRRWLPPGMARTESANNYIKSCEALENLRMLAIKDKEKQFFRVVNFMGSFLHVTFRLGNIEAGKYELMVKKGNDRYYNLAGMDLGWVKIEEENVHNYNLKRCNFYKSHAYNCSFEYVLLSNSDLTDFFIEKSYVNSCVMTCCNETGFKTDGTEFGVFVEWHSGYVTDGVADLNVLAEGGW